jgi:hypothetical protein
MFFRTSMTSLMETFRTFSFLDFLADLLQNIYRLYTRGRGVTPTTHPHLVTRSRMSGSYTYLLSPQSPSWCSGTALAFMHVYISNIFYPLVARVKYQCQVQFLYFFIAICMHPSKCSSLRHILVWTFFTKLRSLLQRKVLPSTDDIVKTCFPIPDKYFSPYSDIIFAIILADRTEYTEGPENPCSIGNYWRLFQGRVQWLTMWRVQRIFEFQKR